MMRFIRLVTILFWLMLLIEYTSSLNLTLLAEDRFEENVAVLPFANYTDVDNIQDKVTKIFVSELVRLSNFQIYHPKVVEKCLEYGEFNKEMSLKEKALRLGTILDADRVIYGAITEYNGFYPPSIGISIEMINVDNNGKSIFSEDIVYDSHLKHIRAKAARYSDKFINTDSLYGWKIVLLNMEKYTHFVCSELINRFFSK